MRTAFIILLAIHGVIHLFGFLKAFDISEFNAIAQPISKPLGALWLLVFLLFLATAILLATQYDYWWMVGTIAVVLSQLLIIVYWTDAKFGTIANLIILAPITLAYATFSFISNVKEEVGGMLADSTTTSERVVSMQAISDLPNVVQTWLINSGVVGRGKFRTYT